FLQNTLWGLLIVHQCSSPRHWRQGEIELLTQLATQLGIALSQGHLLEQEQEQRRQLAQRNHELQQARQVAEAAAAAKGIFLATMSHEVRTPLNAMLGTTELLQYTSLTSDQADLISTLQESGHALLELVNGILDLSKLEAEGIHLDRQTFDLRQVLEHSLDRFALAAEAKGVAVDLHIEPDVPPSVQGDPTRLRQILDHLLSNAVKFTDQGGVVVEVAQVRTELAAEAETTPLKLVGSPSQSAPEDATTSGAEDEWESIDLQIEIRDTGIGIDADYLAFLFQPFSQRDGSTTRRYGGTGLGLALCKQLTLLMGGQIGVKSVPHQGSSFTVTLPFGVSRPENTDLPSQLGEPQPGLKGRRLLVTTSAIRGQIIASLTQSWGMQVEWVANLRQGWEQWQSAQAQGSPYDVWVVDQAVWDQAGWQQGWDPSPQARLDTVPWLMIASPAQFSAFDWDLPMTLVSPPLKQSILQSTLLRLLVDQPSDPQIEWPVAAPAQSQDRLDPVHLASPRHLGFAVKVPASPPQGSHQPTILVVEDNPVNRKLIVRQLNTLGFAADTADHGQTALDLVDQQPYDIILMDCMMPVMDGYTASRLIRQREVHSTGPDQQRIPTTIIAVTANAFSQDRDQCLAAGMDDYLSKPISVDRLEAILHHWIQVRSQLMPPASIDSQAPTESAPTQRQDLPLQAAEPEDPPVITSHTSTSPINIEWLTQISGGDHDFEQELIDTFLEDSAQQRLLIREAVQTCNFGQLAQLAHRMKGASGNLGAEDLQHCSLQLELAAKQGDPQGSQQWLVTLETLLDSLERWVKVSAGS
ncbi:MAG: response regulator, partial [Cyanophyceae cyanobacterium]